MISSNAKKLLSSVDEGFLQLELVDIQSSSALKEDFQEGGLSSFGLKGFNMSSSRMLEKLHYLYSPCLVQLLLVNQAFHTRMPSRQTVGAH